MLMRKLQHCSAISIKKTAYRFKIAKLSWGFNGLDKLANVVSILGKEPSPYKFGYWTNRQKLLLQVACKIDLNFWYLRYLQNEHGRRNVLKNFYRVCHGFRLTKRDDYFQVNFDHFWSEHHFLRQLGQYWKSAWAYKIWTVTKLSLPKSVKLTVYSQTIENTIISYKVLLRFSVLIYISHEVLDAIKESWCQFCQHFTSSFFVQKCFAQLLYAYIWVYNFLAEGNWRKSCS